MVQLLFLFMHVVTSLTISGLFKCSLIICLDGGSDSSRLRFPAFRIPPGRLVCSQPRSVLCEHCLIISEIFMKLGLEAFLHHFLNLLVSDLVGRGDILNHRQAEASNHQAESNIFHIIFLTTGGFLNIL